MGTLAALTLFASGVGALYGAIGGGVTAGWQHKQNAERVREQAALERRATNARYAQAQRQYELAEQAAGLQRTQATGAFDLVGQEVSLQREGLRGEYAGTIEELGLQEREVEFGLSQARETASLQEADVAAEQTQGTAAAAAFGMRGGSGFQSVEQGAERQRAQIDMQLTATEHQASTALEQLSLAEDQAGFQLSQGRRGLDLAFLKAEHDYEATLANIDLRLEEAESQLDYAGEQRELDLENLGLTVSQAEEGFWANVLTGAFGGGTTGLSMGRNIGSLFAT